MPSSHASPTGPPLSVIERPRCQHCQTRTILLLRRMAPSRASYEFRTFACPKCDRVQRTLMVSDPMSGDARGWLRGELKSLNSILAMSAELKWLRTVTGIRSYF